MTREEIKKQWELEFGVKYEDYQRANVYNAVDILDFAESVVNKLLIPDVVVSEERTELPDDKWVTEYCHDHTPYWGVCVTCGRY